MPFKFPQINHRSLVIMDDSKKCCEINTVPLINGLLLVLPWNNDTTIEKMDDCNHICCNWCRQITHFFQYMHAWNQGGKIISNYNVFLLLATIPILQKKIKRMRGCFCFFILLFIKWMAATGIVNYLNTLQKGMTVSACFKETQYPWKCLVTASGLLKLWRYHSNVWPQVLFWNNNTP